MTASEQKKLRLDQLLLDRGLASTRQKAQAIVWAGLVSVNGQLVDKAGKLVGMDVTIEVKEGASRFVGRGGDKIDSMFDIFQIDPEGRVAIDVGASTGGFTDALLQRGAKKVYAIDVGTNQLAYQLRIDSRVKVHENTNIRQIGSLGFDPKPDLVVADLSFISLRVVLSDICQVLNRPSDILLLVKPQFELGREYVEKGGVVRKAENQQLAVKLVSDCAVSLGLEIVGVAPSPLVGLKQGNQEYFLCLKSV